jgi:hypothetical protein
MRANEPMKRMLQAINGVSVGIPDSLRWVESGIIITAEKCFFVDTHYMAPHSPRELFHDEAAYECFVNHVHLDDHIEGSHGQLALALALGRRVKDMWVTSDYRDLPVEFVISLDETSCVFRFHVIRCGQEYLSEELDDYKHDLVLASGVDDEL